MCVMLRLDIANAIMNLATPHRVAHFKQPTAVFNRRVLIKLSRCWLRSLFNFPTSKSRTQLAL